MDHKKGRAEANILIISRIYGTFAEREVVNSVEQIGFPDSIVSGNAIESGAKFDFSLDIIFKINEWESRYLHFCKVT